VVVVPVKGKVLPQTFLFPKDEWNVAQAKAWLKAHAKKYGKVDAKGGHYRFRQFDPKVCRAGRYGTKVWKSGGKEIKAVFCARKTSKGR